MCSFPYSVKNPKFGTVPGETQYMPVPCGTCYECRRMKVNEWVFRVGKEAERHEFQEWVTLTYNGLFVPLTPNRMMTLRKKDIQNFFKRLRKRTDTKIKYFVVGEYGGKTSRPHYHAIIFGATPQQIINAWKLEGNPIGNLHFGKVEKGSLMYTLKYMMKPGKIPEFRGDQREPEFRLMSQKLGSNYLTEKIKKWHRKDWKRNYVQTNDGYKIPLPRYYKEQLYNEDERRLQGKEAKKRAEKKEQDEREKYDRKNKKNKDAKTYEAWKHERRKNSLKKLNRKDEDKH